MESLRIPDETVVYMGPKEGEEEVPAENKEKEAELIYELLENIRATLFRQAMFAEFEKIVHEKIEAGEMLSAEDLNNIYYESVYFRTYRHLGIGAAG